MGEHTVGVKAFDHRTNVTMCLLGAALLHAVACAPVAEPVGEVSDWRVVHYLVCTTVVQRRAYCESYGHDGEARADAVREYRMLEREQSRRRASI